MDNNNSNMVGAFAVSNEMLYELLRDLKSDMNRRFDEVDRRFEDVDRRFEDVDRRFVEMNCRMDEFKEENHRDHEAIHARISEFKEENRHDHAMLNDKLDEVYKNREKVTVNFTKVWAFASLVIAMLASGISMVLIRVV